MYGLCNDVIVLTSFIVSVSLTRWAVFICMTIRVSAVIAKPNNAILYNIHALNTDNFQLSAGILMPADN